MPEMLEHLIRVSAIARLDGIISALATQTKLATAERGWFASLLCPISPREAGQWQPLPSDDLPPELGGAVAQMLLQEYAFSSADELERRVQRLASVWRRLRSEEDPLADDVRLDALDVARMLRHHFLKVF